MIFPSRITDLFQTAGNRQRILLHGDLAHIYKDGWSVETRQDKTPKPLFIQGARPIIFLAAPFVHTFVHDTIQLSKKELETADRQLLGFSDSEPAWVNITSLGLTDKKTLTIHSHLTHKGSDLLRSLRQLKTGFSWHPAILSFIVHIHQNPDLFVGTSETVRVFLADEVLQVDKQVEQLRFQHLNFLNNHGSHHSRKSTAVQLIERGGAKQETANLSFDSNTPIKSTISPITVSGLLTPPHRRRDTKSSTIKQNKRRISVQSILTRNHFLGLTLFFVAIWAVFVQFRVSEVNRQRQIRRDTITILEKKSIRLGQVAEIERKHARYSAIKQTANRLRIQPSFHLTKLAGILPKGLWIQAISIQHDQIIMDLLDSGKTELNDLMELIGNVYGTTSLKSNEEITIDKIPVRRYKIAISQLKPQP